MRYAPASSATRPPSSPNGPAATWDSTIARWSASCASTSTSSRSDACPSRSCSRSNAAPPTRSLPGGQPKRKDRPGAERALDRHVAAHESRQLTTDRETQARPARVILAWRRGRLHERLEDHFEILRCDAASGVLDAHVGPHASRPKRRLGARAVGGAARDGDAPVTIRELDGVRQEVEHDLTHAILVADVRHELTVGRSLVRELDPFTVSMWPHKGKCRFDRHGHVAGLARDRQSARLRGHDIEQVAHQRREMTIRVEYAVDIRPLLLGERPADILDEQVRVAQRGVDWRAQLVAHHAQE